MPIYEYVCKECNNKFEYLIVSSSDSDKEKITCPSCKSQKVEKMISAPSRVKVSSNAGMSGGSCPSGICGI